MNLFIPNVLSVLSGSSPRDSKHFCLHFENYRSGNGRKAGTVEPRFNDLRYNDIPSITINNLLPAQLKLQ